MISNDLVQYGKNLKSIIETIKEDEDRLVFVSETYIKDRRILEVLSLEDALTHHVAFGFQKDSEFRQLFDHHLFKMEQSGLLDKIKTKPKPHESKITSALSLGYNNVMFPFVILLSGFGLALACILIEKAKMNLCRRKITLNLL